MIRNVKNKQKYYVLAFPNWNEHYIRANALGNFQIIIVTSNGCHCVSNRQHFDCLLKLLIMLAERKNTIVLNYWHIVGNLPRTGAFFSMSWRYNMGTVVHCVGSLYMQFLGENNTIRQLSISSLKHVTQKHVTTCQKWVRFLILV